MRKQTIILGVLLMSLAACANQLNESRPSSAGYVTYAIDYPAQLAELTNRYETNLSTVRSNITLYGTALDSLEEPNWRFVQEIYDAANEAGKNPALAQQVHDIEVISAFIEAERGTIAYQINYSIQKSAEKDDDEVFDTRNVVKSALSRAVDKQLTKRFESANEAHLLLDRYHRQLGKKNSGVLEEHIGLIWHTSFLVHLELPRVRGEIEHRLGEVEQIRATLEQSIRQEQELQASDVTSKKDRKSSEQRLKTLQDAQGALDDVIAGADQLMQQTKEAYEPLLEEYESTFDALLDEVEQRVEEASTDVE